MVDRGGIRRVIATSRDETAIMAVTFGATLALPLEFAVLCGVILSLAVYIYQSSMPTVHPVVPDEHFRHMVERPGAPQCPQLAVMNIRGTLFFGATAHVEEALLANFFDNPGQHRLLLRMHGVTQCDLSGIEMLESVVRHYRGAGGDVFMVQVRPPVREAMRQSGFEALLGADHILAQEEAIEHLFENTLDPAVCIYECEHRVFAECQALVKHHYEATLPAYAVRPARRLEHLGVTECEKLLAAEPAHAARRRPRARGVRPRVTSPARGRCRCARSGGGAGAAARSAHPARVPLGPPLDARHADAARPRLRARLQPARRRPLVARRRPPARGPLSYYSENLRAMRRFSEQ